LGCTLFVILSEAKNLLLICHSERSEESAFSNHYSAAGFRGSAVILLQPLQPEDWLLIRPLQMYCE
jgi:hypothetical protein